MKRQLFYLATAALFALPVKAQEKQRIYTLKTGEKLMMAESGLRTSSTANSYMIVVEKENADSQNGTPSYYLLTDRQTYGPYGSTIADFYSGDMKRRATVLPDINNDYEKGIEKNYVLFDDGTMMGPYNGFPTVSFNQDGSDWAIVVSKYEGESNVVNTTIRFKSGAKDLIIKGSEYVEFAPKGNTSVRIASKENSEGNYLISFIFSDGRKMGPWLLNNHQFSEDGKSYLTLREEKDGSKVFSINDKETRFDASQNVSGYYANEDASDWVMMSYQEDRAKLIFRNGEETELYERVAESTIEYDKNAKQWLYMTASKEKMSADLHLGNKIIHSFPLTAKDIESSNTDEPYFFIGGFVQWNKEEKQALIQYYVNESSQKYFLYTSGIDGIKELPSENVTYSNFDGKNQVYFVKEKPGKTEDELPTYYMEGAAKAVFKSYPDELNFIENSNNWYVIYWGDNSLQLSDGSFYENAFDVKYDKATRKLTWLSLEGREVYVNRKAY